MSESIPFALTNQEGPCDRSSLDELLRLGAQRMLQAAIEQEVETWVAAHREFRVDDGTRRFVRNGRMRERELLTPSGRVRVRQPRVHDREGRQRFTSSILPPYMRRTPTLDALIPVLVLKGISTGQFQEAFESILGPDAAGLSAKSVERLTKAWHDDYARWRRRDLTGRRYVYWWVDGIYFNVRLQPGNRQCFLIVMGALEDGTKELVAVRQGVRESDLSWGELMCDLKRRGLEYGPKLATGDGALGFWKALEREYPETRRQRCWVHKTANILDKLPKSVQAGAKRQIHDIYLADTRMNAERAFDDFLRLHDAKYPKACECLRKDRDDLLSFYDFPAAHWQHIRTTNPIESTFATVRHRTRRTKGCGSPEATLAMVFKLSMEAERHWRRIRGYKLIPKVISGVKFIDGEEAPPGQHVA